MSIKAFSGWMLLAIFGVAALSSGGCTLFFLADELKNFRMDALPLILLIGGVPFIIFWSLAYLGYRLVTKEPEKKEKEKDNNG